MAEEPGPIAGAGGPEQPPANYKRLDFKKQSLDDAYAAPANLLEIEVTNAETHGYARNRYTDYEVRMRVSAYRTVWVVVAIRLVCVSKANAAGSLNVC